MCSVFEQSDKTFSNSNKICVVNNNHVGLNQTKTFYDLNVRLVYGLRAIGKGYTSAQRLCGILNLPAPPTQYKKHELFIGGAIQTLCEDSMRKVVEEAVFHNENSNNRDLYVACLLYTSRCV